MQIDESLAAATARRVIERLLAGEPPDETRPEVCGGYADVVCRLYDAFGIDGTAQVRREFLTLQHFRPDLTALLAADLPADSAQEGGWHASTFVALPNSAQPPADAAEGGCPWLDAYVAFSRRWSPRAYDHYHEAVGLWVLATVAARRVVLHHGGPRYTNLYIALVARTSLFAKTTTARIGLEVLRAAGLGELLLPDEATPQALVQLMSRRPGDLAGAQAEHEPLRDAFAGQRGWYYDEFGQKVAAMMRERGPMTDFRGLLRRLDDGVPKYESVTVGRGSDRVERPYLALLANTTPADLRPFARRGAQLWNDGFWARFALIAPPPDAALSRARFPEGERQVPATLLQPLADWHDRLGVPPGTFRRGDTAGSAGSEQPCVLRPEAREAYEAYDEAMRALIADQANDDLDGNYTRFPEKALRCAMLFASLENDGLIELRHWARAQAIAERWRQDLHHLVDQLHHEPEAAPSSAAGRVLELLQRKGRALTGRELQQGLRLKSEELRRSLEELTGRGQLVCLPRGRTTAYALASDDDGVGSVEV